MAFKQLGSFYSLLLARCRLLNKINYRTYADRYHKIEIVLIHLLNFSS